MSTGTGQYKYVDGELIELTPEEVAEIERERLDASNPEVPQSKVEAAPAPAPAPKNKGPHHASRRSR